MIIRGIDFARHNVIVGTEAETPVSNTAQGQTSRGEAVARVLSVTGSEATLDVNGQRVVVESHVPLNAGDKLFVRVFEGAGGQIRLSVLSSGPDEGTPPAQLAETDVDDLLRGLGLPTDDRTRATARALLARDGSITRPAVQKLLAALRQFPDVTAREANAGALLQKAGVPVNAATVAVVANRAEPNAPLQLGARLTSIAPELESLKRSLPTRSPLNALVDDALHALKGLPLDEQASEPRITQALGQWLKKLSPPEPKPTTLPAQGRAGLATGQGGPVVTDAQGRAEGQGGPQTSQGRPLGGQGGPTAETAPADAGRLPDVVRQPAATAGRIDPALLAEPMIEQAEALPEAAEPTDGDRPAAGNPKPQVTERGTDLRPDTAKQGLERGDRVSPSHPFSPRVGISTKVLEPAGSDLASTLERIGKGLGPEHQKLGSAIREAVAELRYAQLANAPTPQGNGTGLEFLIPLLVPQLSAEHPEGRIQVFHKPAKKGEPIDPNNVRLVFVLETEHLNTVQADVTIKDGVIDLNLGVPDAENQKFLAEHIEELEAAITKQGWETGRFNARVAKAPPPKVRQEEGLTDIVRFDRRV